jgi:hypothetical protein
MASSEYYRDRRKSQKEKAINYLGGVCAICFGKDELEFDHIKAKVNGGTKRMNISCMLHYSWDNLKEELDLCQLLCKPCHIQKTLDDLPDWHYNKKGNINHGSINSYNNGCRCEKCLNIHKEYNNKRRQRRSRLRLGGGNRNVSDCKSEYAGASPVRASKLPRGVRKVRERYRASTTVNYKHIHLGMFDTPEEAHNAYRNFNKKNRPWIDTEYKYQV